MKKKLWMISLLTVFLLPVAGSIRPGKYIYRYVTQAEVVFFQSEQQQVCHYTDPSKISSLLTCLRLAAPYGQVKTAEANPNAHHYRITLQYSDQTRQVYHLQDYRYLSKDGKTWQKVPPKKAHYLYLLLRMLPSDL